MNKIYCLTVLLFLSSVFASAQVIVMLFLALPATANVVDFELPVPVNLNDEAVLFVQDMGIMTGSEDGQFHPEVSLSRCELSKIALLAGKITLVASSAPQAFSDISTNNWCHVYAATEPTGCYWPLCKHEWQL